jgi:hypothetical protein
LNDEIEVSDIHVDELPGFLGQNVTDGIKKDSLAEARSHIAILEEQVETDERPRDGDRQRDRNNTKD